MTNSEIRTAHVQVTNGDLGIAAYLAEPVVASPVPAIVVLQEIFGVNEHIRDVTERLAKLGYVTIAPALFQRTAPGFEVGYTPEAMQMGRDRAQQTKAEELLGDIQATIAYLHTLPSVKPGPVGCIGFCYGGHIAYLAATLPDIKATASFYGARIAASTFGPGAPTLTRTPDIQGTLYAFFGLDDSSIPVDQIDEIAEQLKRHDIPHRIFRYPGAGHGFFCDRRASYNPEAAADAWLQVQQLFQETL